MLTIVSLCLQEENHVSALMLSSWGWGSALQILVEKVGCSRIKWGDPSRLKRAALIGNFSLGIRLSDESMC